MSEEFKGYVDVFEFCELSCEFLFFYQRLNACNFLNNFIREVYADE